MTFAKTLTLCCCLGVFHVLQGQTLIFEGLKRTTPQYLRQIMDWEKHVPTNPDEIAIGVQRLLNTRFFNTAQSQIIINDTDTTVIVKCPEIFTVLPIFEFGASEGNRWLRLGVEDENGLGRGIKSIVFYQYNDRHSFFIKQKFPLMFGKWGLNYLVKNWSILEPISTPSHDIIYNYTNRDAEILTQYAFDINQNNLEMGVGYMKETFDPSATEMYEMTDDMEYERVLVKVNHYLNFQNHNSIYVKGWSSKTQLMGACFAGNTTPFGSFLNESKYFKMVPHKGNIALRSIVGVSTNVNALLSPFVFDNYSNIRGIGNRIERGTAMITINAEYRQTIWENRTFGIQLVGFTDMGTMRLPNEQLNNLWAPQNMRVFVGLGGRFIYKKAYETDLRIDYGTSLYGSRRGLVVGLGQYF